MKKADAAGSDNSSMSLRKYEQSDILSYPHFFIVGTQRSGTTLLRLILNSHSSIAIPEEAAFFMPFLTRKKLLDPKPLPLSVRKNLVNYLINNYQFKKWKLDESKLLPILENSFSYHQVIGFLYKTFAQKYGKSICGDKSPAFIRKLNLLLEAYPKAKIIHIIRDGRDVYLSFKKKNHPAASSIAGAALEWRIKLFLISRAIKTRQGSVIEVKYEDLLQHPVSVIEKICAFLGIAFENEMLEFWKQSSEFIDQQHSDLIFKPIQTSNINKWETLMSSAELAQYEFFAQKGLKEYGYPISQGNPNFIKKLIFISNILSFLPKRICKIMQIALRMRIASMYGLEVSSQYYE
ncbi:MAG: sulfotransferase [bacterium]|nr:sulfotransferase [bacterium]